MRAQPRKLSSDLNEHARCKHEGTTSLQLYYYYINGMVHQTLPGRLSDIRDVRLKKTLLVSASRRYIPGLPCCRSSRLFSHHPSTPLRFPRTSPRTPHLSLTVLVFPSPHKLDPWSMYVLPVNRAVAKVSSALLSFRWSAWRRNCALPRRIYLEVHITSSVKLYLLVRSVCQLEASLDRSSLPTRRTAQTPFDDSHTNSIKILKDGS